MNKYETIFLVKNDTTEEQRNKVVSNVESYLKENGKIIKTEALGLRKLAYEIRKCKEAYYYLFEFESASETISELERRYRIEDLILKFIVVRKEG